MKEQNKYRFIIAAGGTGGHLFPAIAVADKLKIVSPTSEILFIGTKDKIESRIVPQKGYNFKHISVVGFARRFSIKNLFFPFKLLFSILQALSICMKFKPQIAIGSGAYVSGPVLWAAKIMGAKLVLLEQNSYPGVTNRMLEKNASEIYLSFKESKKYFRESEKLHVTGNPIRLELNLIEKQSACEKLNINSNKITLLVIGGSLGAKSINEAIRINLEKLESFGINILWQTGKNYYEEYKNYSSESTLIWPFIEDMQAVYSAADVVVARSGASTIAEVANLGKATIFIPSPNVAANHQFKNAEALFNKNAAILLNDKNASENLFEVVKSLVNNDLKIKELETNITQFANKNAVEVIVERILKLTRQSF